MLELIAVIMLDISILSNGGGWILREIRKGDTGVVKDIIIALLAAVVLSDAPFWVFEGAADRTAIVLGLAMVLFYFFTFLEIKWEAYLAYKARIRKMQQQIKEIRLIRLDKDPK